MFSNIMTVGFILLIVLGTQWFHYCINLLFNSGKCWWTDSSLIPFSATPISVLWIVIWVWAQDIYFPIFHCSLLYFLSDFHILIFQLLKGFKFYSSLISKTFPLQPVLQTATCFYTEACIIHTSLLTLSVKVFSSKSLYFDVALASHSGHFPHVWWSLAHI